jgi:hypothetical protein
VRARRFATFSISAIIHLSYQSVRGMTRQMQKAEQMKVGWVERFYKPSLLT